MESELNGNVKEQRRTFSRNVNFIHEVNFGGPEKIQVKGEIPHFRPKYYRKRWDSMAKDVEKLEMESVDWARQVMRIEDEDLVLKKLSMISTLFAVYSNPQLELFSCKMIQLIRLMLWLWVFDDFIDVTACSQISYEDMHQATIILIDLLKGKYDTELVNLDDKPTLQSSKVHKFESIPIFSQVFDGLFDIRKECLKIFPDFDLRSQGVIRALELPLQAVEWNCLTKLDQTYSLEMFRRFRSADGAALLCLEFFALHHGIVIPMEIRRNLIFRKYSELFADVIAFTNDILGLAKDLNTHYSSKGDADNTVMFQILNKNVKLEIAVARSVDDIKERLEDLMQLKVALLTAFPSQPDLHAFINLAETAIDGHYLIYCNGHRYSNKHVTIKDNEELEE